MSIETPDRIRVIRDHCEHVDYAAFAFDLFDSKGREFGHQFSIEKVRWTPAPPDHGDLHVYLVKPEWVGDFYYAVSPHAMRDGKVFGAIPVNAAKRFHTLEEARRYGWACVVKGRKASEKKAV